MTDTKMIKTAGEHWVASVLARHGWAPALTRDGIERTDILAVRTGDSRQMIEVQVKATTATTWPLGDLSARTAKSSREWFALVQLPPEPTALPRTFVVPRDHVAAANWIEHQAWLTEPGVPEGKRNAGHDRARSHLSSYLGYEDRWDLLDDPTDITPILLTSALRALAFDRRVGFPPWHPWSTSVPDWQR